MSVTEPSPKKDKKTKATSTNIKIRVYYEDTDAGGIVYYANYLKFAERGRTEWLRSLGTDHQKLLADHNLLFAVKHLSVDYKAPAKLDNLLNIGTEITECGAATLDMRQIIGHEETTLAVLEVKLASITPAGKVIRLPDWLRKTAQARLVSKGSKK